MIFGIGVDSTAIRRVEKSLQSQAFWQRVFGAQEQQLLQGLQGKKRRESAAANFAAKEAFLKACGKGIGGFALAEIQILRLPSGAPHFALRGAARQWLLQNKLTAHLSLTHEGETATAFVVLSHEAAKKSTAND